MNLFLGFFTGYSSAWRICWITLMDRSSKLFVLLISVIRFYLNIDNDFLLFIHLKTHWDSIHIKSYSLRFPSYVILRHGTVCVLLPLIAFFFFRLFIIFLHSLMSFCFISSSQSFPWCQSFYRKSVIFIIAGDKYLSESNSNAVVVRTCLLSLLDRSPWIFQIIPSTFLTLYSTKAQITLCLFLSCD